MCFRKLRPWTVCGRSHGANPPLPGSEILTFRQFWKMLNNFSVYCSWAMKLLPRLVLDPRSLKNLVWGPAPLLFGQGAGPKFKL